MSKRSIYSLSVSVLVLTLVAVGALPAVGMQEEDQRHSTKIHIDRDGDDGERVVSKHKVVFINEDGETTEVEGEGGHFSWHDGEEGHHVRMAMPRFSMREGAFLGVSTTQMTPELRQHFGAPSDAGVMISQVVDDSGAFGAGLLVGDIITAVDGEAIASSMDLLHAVRGHEEGDSITVEIFRDGKAQNVAAVLGKTEGHAWAFEGLPHRPGAFPRGLKIDCEEDGGDCDILLSRRLDMCDGDEECDVKISCSDGDCTCTVNGAETDCDELHGVHVMPDH